MARTSVLRSKTLAQGAIHLPRASQIGRAPAEWDIPWGADMQVRSQNDGPVTILFDINEE